MKLASAFKQRIWPCVDNSEPGIIDTTTSLSRELPLSAGI